MSTEIERRWMAAWRSAGPALARIRDEELRQLDEEAGTRAAMLLGVVNPPLRATSGLIEFQQWMRKWRGQLG